MLANNVRLHEPVGAGEAAYRKYLPGHADRHQVDEYVAEKPDVLHRDYDRERHDGEEKHLVVGEAEAEDERRYPQHLVGRLAHPAVGQQEHPHEEEGVQGVYLYDG